MPDKNDLVKVALSYVGTAENPLGSNKQIFGEYIDKTNWYEYKDGDKTWIHKVNGFDWCTTYHDFCFVKCFGIDEARRLLNRPRYNNLGAVVKYAYGYMNAIGKISSTPEIGCSIYFKNDKGLSHIGIVYDYDDMYVYTVEGNAGKNCWYVVKNKYLRTYNRIVGYDRPLYNEKPKKYPNPPFKAICTLKGVAMRDIPYSDGNIIATIKEGATVTVEKMEGSSGDFAKISGYVYLPGGFKWEV